MLEQGETRTTLGLVIGALLVLMVLISGAASAKQGKVKDEPLVCFDVGPDGATASVEFNCEEDDGDEDVDGEAHADVHVDEQEGEAGADAKLKSADEDVAICLTTQPRIVVQRSTSCDGSLTSDDPGGDLQIDPTDLEETDLDPSDVVPPCVRVNPDEPAVHVDRDCISDGD